MAKVGPKWDDELCSEHDGSIASFERLGMKLTDISQFDQLFRRDKKNLLHAGKVGIGAALGIAAVGTGAIYAGPAIASALGTTGLLGAAGTGTAISSLSGAALTSASLAAIGGGTMAAGTAFITATGAMLGAYQGGAISNAYFGQVEHFKVRHLRSGHSRNKHAVIVVNGFMSQGSDDANDWSEHLQDHFSRNSWYHTDWEAKNLRKLGSYIAATPKAAGMGMAKGMAMRAGKSLPSKVGALGVVTTAADLVNNPWHIAMSKASMTGILLADAIARTPGWRFTLAGHSLGARVIYFALEALRTKPKRVIENVYLLGGAVGGGAKDAKGWGQATEAVKGQIYNCYSKNDAVLKFLYQGASGYRSSPIGYHGISLQHEKIFDLDCSDIVGSHMGWKNQFGEILTHLHN